MSDAPRQPQPALTEDRAVWHVEPDGVTVPVVEGIAYHDRARSAGVTPLPRGTALERLAIGWPLDAVRLWTEPPDDVRPPPPPNVLAGLVDQTAALRPRTVLVLGGGGLVGELIAAGCPAAKVTSLLDRGRQAPSPAAAHGFLRTGERATNHAVAFAAASVAPTPLAKPFDVIVRGDTALPGAWLDAAGHDRHVGDAVWLDTTTARPEPVPAQLDPHLRLLVRRLGPKALDNGVTGDGRALDPTAVEIVHFGRRGLTLGAIARHCERPYADVAMSALALARDGLVQPVRATAAAARLHHYLATGEPLPAPSETTPRVLWRRAVARHGDRQALILHDGTALTYAEADRLVARFAAALGDLGVAPGGRIGIVTEPSVELFALIWAGLCYGLTLTAIPPTTPADAVADLSRRLQLEAVFADRSKAPGRALADDARVNLVPFAATLVDTSENAPTPSEPRAWPKDDGAAAVISLTSGTTGRSKAVLTGARAIVTSALSSSRAYGWQADDRILTSQVPATVNEWRAAFLCPAVVGAAHLLGVAPQPGHLFRLWALADDHSATRLLLSSAVASSLHDALASGRLSPIRSLTTLQSGGAHLAPTLRDELVARLSVTYLLNYGTTECGTLAAERTGPASGPVPIALPIVRQIRDDDGQVAAPGAAGTCWVLHDGTMEGYVTEAGIDRHALAGAWFTPNDVVRHSDDGRVEVVGRPDDLFSIATGQLVMPRPIEAVLEEHPAVAAAAVVPGVDDAGGACIVAVVEPYDDPVLAAPTAGELRAWVMQHLGPEFAPRRVRQVDRLPRNRNGKLLRRQLAEPEPDAAG
ncbi:MAG: class I adenylate-forming enzyme family protein [Pseudomonadota bacterium]